MEDARANSERMRPVLPAHAFVFIASFCLMVIELVAGRAMAPYVGASLYTWTSVIGLVLTGITVGNWIGGVLADRGATWRTVGYVFGAAGFVTVLSYYSYAPLGRITYDLGLPLPVATFVFSLVAFFPIAFLLSLITPIVITLSLDSLKKTGTTVGRIYAVSAFASILGTFATGYVLIAWFGVKLIVLSVGAVLLLVGIFAAKDRSFTASPPTALAVLLLWGGFLMPKACDTESNYFCIKAAPAAVAGGTYFRLDRLVHSIVFADPRRLAYEYETIYAIATEYVATRRSEVPLRTLYLGGGADVMPKFVEANYPGAEMTVVEIDPGVSKVVRQRFPHAPDSRIVTVNDDARMFLARGAAGEYDLIFGDAFNDFSMPFHLTTEEYLRLVKAHMSPGGMYALNTIDSHAQGRLLASFIATAEKVFAHVEVAPTRKDGAWRDLRRNTFVLLMSDEPLDRDLWADAGWRAYAKNMSPPHALPLGDALALLAEEERRDLVKEKRGIAFTDDYVPADNLIAPVFVDGY